MQVSDWFGAQGKVIDWVGDRFQDTPLLWMIVVRGRGRWPRVSSVRSASGSRCGGTTAWSASRAAPLRVRRGLFTSRSISIEERRLRGVELVEPLGVRLFGAARLDAVATGLAQDDERSTPTTTCCCPPRRVPLADAVAAQVLREEVSPTGGPLTAPPARRPRPPAALGTRRGPRPGPAARGSSGRWLTPVLLWIALGCAVVALPPRWSSPWTRTEPGPRPRGGYLVTRSGTVRRSTVALQRAGVIGWTVKQSFFQRRAGLLTLTATTAAGSGGVLGVRRGAAEGLDFAAEAVPGLLEPFLERNVLERDVRPGP